MRIRIESQNAKNSSIFRRPIKSKEGDIERIELDFHLQPQLKDNWCWASIGQEFFRYMQGIQLSQPEIVSRIFGRNSTADEIPVNSIGNLASVARCRDLPDEKITLDKVLSLSGSFSHWSLGKPSFERIQFELLAARPVCARIELRNGGGHYVVITGCNHRIRSLLIDDSKLGPSEIGFEDFPKEYSIPAVWTDTFWISEIPNGQPQ